MLKWASLAAVLLMVTGLLGQFYTGHLFGRSPLAIGVQIAAAGLMIAARLAFGLRSFHAAANPTAGGLVTSGPYKYIRHPIYAAVIYFVWAGALDRWSWVAIAGASAVTVSGFVRMLAEERLVVARYPEYRDYQARVRRIVPYVV